MLRKVDVTAKEELILVKKYVHKESCLIFFVLRRLQSPVNINVCICKHC